jgi:coproporphyrinogen III oxidase-like Fe-S oxidoreductase
LQFLGRNHTAKEAVEVIKTTAKIFDNFSFDLIYSLPGQELKNWQEELRKALYFQTKHLSLYQLTIEKGTKFYKKHQEGDFIMPKDNISAKFYEETGEIMVKNGYIDYEISNYAKKGFESQHNLAYWRSKEYLGIGAGAHSRVKIDGVRNSIQMLSLPRKWLEKVEKDGFGVQKQEKISENQFLEEFLLMGLRLKKGLENSDFIDNFGKNISDLIEISKLQYLIGQNLLLCDENWIKITDSGRLLTNLIIEKIVENIL